jgi:3-deoxy-D-manno-octulosonic-acid transferase
MIKRTTEVIFRQLYNFGISLYALIVRIVSLRNKKAGLMVRGQSESFSIIREKMIPGEKYWWFHAASLGEFEQGRPLMEALKQSNPEIKILLTFFSPSGYEIRKNYTGADIIAYLPFDTPGNAVLFLKTISVSKAFFIKYEFWPNYLRALNKSNIPVYSVSAIFRPDQYFFKHYGKWYLNQLSAFTHIFVQDEGSAKLLKSHQIQNITVAGDTRFDRVTNIASQAKTIPVIAKFAEHSTLNIVAGSTWLQDEEILIRWMKENPEAKLILVPHEIHESHIQDIIRLTGDMAVRFSQADINTVQSYNCLILDTMGMLSSVYQYGNLAYVGGGFGVGIHNILEAAVWNIPVIFGPNHQKFREAKALMEVGGAKSINGYDELSEAFKWFENHPETGKIAGDYVKTNCGATEIILKSIL